MFGIYESQQHHALPPHSRPFACNPKPSFHLIWLHPKPGVALIIPKGSTAAMVPDPVREGLLAFATILGALALLGAAATACKDSSACARRSLHVPKPRFIDPRICSRRLDPALQPSAEEAATGARGAGHQVSVPGSRGLAPHCVPPPLPLVAAAGAVADTGGPVPPVSAAGSETSLRWRR